MAEEYYEEKEFDGEMYFRLAPGGAYFKKKTLYNKDDAPIDKMLKFLRDRLDIATVGELMVVLDTAPSVICRIRKGHIRIPFSLLVRMHDVSMLSINELRAIGGLPLVEPLYKKEAPLPQPEVLTVGTGF